MTDPQPRWLSPEELAVWQSLHTLLVLLPVALDRQLQRDSELSYLEYYVLAYLSDSPGGARRLSDLAVITNAELSRISHLVTRLERRGLLRRQPDPDDGRYTNAMLTDQGYAQVRQAAPGHVTAVRELIFDRLDVTTRSALDRATNLILDALGEAGLADPRVPRSRRER